jgi:hypothetical protein
MIHMSGFVNYCYQWESGFQGDCKGTLSAGAGAAARLPCHAERSEAARGPGSEALRYAQGDKRGPWKVSIE